MEILRNALIFLGFACCVVACASPHALAAPTLQWLRQIRTPQGDSGSSITGDSFGNVFVHGGTQGSLGGPHSGVQSQLDLFVTKLNSLGNIQWTRQYGDDSHAARSLTADSLGNVIVTTYTTANRSGTNAGGRDAVTYKLNGSGEPIWTRQLGTNAFDVGIAVAADKNRNVLLAGYTYGNLAGPNSGDRDAFLAKYDADGGLAWVRQFGSPGPDMAITASADGLGGYYVAGSTRPDPNVFTTTGFVRKYDDEGNPLWTREIDAVGLVSADSLGNVFVLGNTTHHFPNSSITEVFVTKYDSVGNRGWTRIITSGQDRGHAIWADGLGNVLIAGDTEGNLGGLNAGMSDAFVTKLDSDGELVWNYQLGAFAEDRAEGIWADSRGNILVTGYTEGYLEGSVETLNDAWVALLREDVLQGDFNRNGLVDAADYVVWRKGLTSGEYTLDDYNTWRANFGAPAAGAATAGRPLLRGAVPEPTAIALVAVVFLPLSFRRRPPTRSSVRCIGKLRPALVTK